MIKFFKDAYIYQYIAVVLTAIALWVPGFIMTEVEAPATVADAPLYNLFSFLLGFSPFVKRLFALVLVILLSFFFNSILSLNQFIPRTSSIGAFIFVVLFSMHGSMTEFYPLLLALIPIFALLNTIFLIYHTKNPEVYLLNAGFFVAVASMFYAPSAFLLIWIFLSIFRFGERDIRSYLIPVVGFLFPYIVYFAICYSTGSLSEQLLAYRTSLSGYAINFKQFATLDYWYLGISAFILLVCMLMSGNVLDRSITVNKKLASVKYMLVFSIFFMFATMPIMQNGLFIAIVALFVSIVLGNIRHQRLANVLMIISLVAIVFGQYFELIKSCLHES